MSLKSLCGLICGASYTKGLDGPDGASTEATFKAAAEALRHQRAKATNRSVMFGEKSY
jgi:hypothetical protein